MSRAPRKLEAERLIVASHNPGKVTEIEALVAPFGIEAISAGALNLPEPEETGSTFAENAGLKALAAAAGGGLPALADDSGLAVDALGGQPGIYSARWAGPAKDFRSAMEKLEQALVEKQASGATARRAHFICALCLAWPDGHAEQFEGRISGALVWPPRGNRGFGYDPVFQADGETRTFGEMAPEKKHAMSHRARAFDRLRQACME